MFRASFLAPEDSREALLDALLPLLPAGVREDGDVLSTIAGVRARPRRAGGRAGARAGRLGGRGGAGRLARAARARGRGRDRRRRVGSRSARPGTRRRPTDVIDVVVERRGGAFGSGSHPTTQMCLALLLELEVAGGVADLGCGVGTLAIAAAKLGWGPVVAVDRVPIAIEVARENVERNRVVGGVRRRRPGRRRRCRWRRCCSSTRRRRCTRASWRRWTRRSAT